MESLPILSARNLICHRLRWGEFMKISPMMNHEMEIQWLSIEAMRTKMRKSNLKGLYPLQIHAMSLIILLNLKGSLSKCRLPIEINNLLRQMIR
jgi:hypothetical protein